MKTSIHIERVVLDGLPAVVEGRGMHEGLQTELAELLSRGELSHEFAQGAAIPRLDAPEISITIKDGPGDVGKRIARAVHGAIGNANAPIRPAQFTRPAGPQHRLRTGVEK